MGDPVLTAQTDLLKGTFTWNWTFTLDDTHWQHFQNKFGTLDIFADPQFQLQPKDGNWQPAQLAINMNILQWTWPKIGPLIVQCALAGGWQWTDGQGTAATVAPGLDLSTSYLPWLHLSGQVQLTNTLDEHGRLHSEVSVPVSTLSGRFRF